MQGPIAPWLAPFGDAGRARQAAVLAGSVALHALVLGWLALTALGLDAPYAAQDDPPVAIIPLWIEPRPLLPDETARIPSSRSDPVVDRPSTTGQGAMPVPAPPAPRMAAMPPADAPAPPDDPWRVQPQDQAAAIGRSLRGGLLGCRSGGRTLSADEQAECDQRLGAAAARAGPPGPRTLTAAEARREAGFARDGAQALARYEAQRAPLAGGVGVVGPADCIGSNFGVGCAGAHLDPSIRQGGATNIRQRSNKTDAMRPIPGAE